MLLLFRKNIILKYFLHYFSFVLLFYSVCSSAFSLVAPIKNTPTLSLNVSFGIYKGTYEKYKTLIQPNFCQQSFDYENKQIDRVVAEVQLACMALETQGINLKVNFIVIPNDQRGIKMLQQGELDTLAASVWHDKTDKVHTNYSVPVIRRGEFEKGIYVLESNELLLSLSNERIDLTKLRGVGISRWLYDWRILKKLTSNVIKTDYIPAIFSLLATQRADFTLMEFPAKNSLKVCSFNNHCLLPIQGIKVVVDNSRHFIVSKRSTNAKKYYQHLNNGLKHLRAKGKIQTFYEDIGLFNAHVSDWEIIN